MQPNGCIFIVWSKFGLDNLILLFKLRALTCYKSRYPFCTLTYISQKNSSDSLEGISAKPSRYGHLSLLCQKPLRKSIRSEHTEDRTAFQTSRKTKVGTGTSTLVWNGFFDYCRWKWSAFRQYSNGWPCLAYSTFKKPASDDATVSSIPRWRELHRRARHSCTRPKNNSNSGLDG